MNKTLPAARVLLFLFVLALSLRLYIFLTTHYSADDALIIFRYAENLAHGLGFVYNSGEHVLGTTTPLYTLLIFLFLKVGISVFWSSFVISQIADFASAWLLLRIFEDIPTAIRPYSWLPAFLFLFSPETLQWSLSGMETELAVALILGACYLSSRESWNAAFVVAAIAILVRIDAVALLGAVFLMHVASKRSIPWKPLLAGGLVLLPWFLFAFLYFGSFVPNSAAAKIALSGHSLPDAFFDIFVKGFLHLTTYGFPILILALLGTIHIWKERKELLALAVWTWGYAISYTLAAGPMHPWYYVPFYAGYLVLAFLGLFVVARKIELLQRQPVAALLTIVLVIATLFFSYQRAETLEELQKRIRAVNQETGLWLRQNSPKDAVLAIKDIGFIGYYSDRRILDLAGLVSPQCIPYRAKGDFLGPIAKYQPDYFAFSGGQLKTLNLEQSGLLGYYRPVKVIAYGSASYTIFQREKP